MTRPLSNDLRRRIIRTVEGGLSRNAAAKKFEVSVSAVVKLLQQWATTGSCEPKQIGGYRKHLLAEHVETVNRLLAEKPDITLAEMKKQLAIAKINAGQSSISRFLNHLGYSYKKNGTRCRARTRGR
jgi:putative transposase